MKTVSVTDKRSIMNTSQNQENQVVWNNVKKSISSRNPTNDVLHAMLKTIRLKDVRNTEKNCKEVTIILSAFHKQWIQKNDLLTELATEVKKQFQQFSSDKITLSLEQSNEGEALEKNSQYSFNLDDHSKKPLKITKSTAANEHTINETQKPTKIYHGNLMKNYIFESFIVGPNNEIAHNAAFTVAESIRKNFYQKELNPLFIYGPSGMGKTHLLQAVGHYAQKHNPKLKIFYLECQEFMRQCVNSLQTGKISRFQDSFAKDCDILLIDDVQVLKRGEFVQDEFFRVINNLINKNCQILVAGDRKPAQIEGLDDRIRTRLSWGLIIDIKKPDIETRLAILEYKASLKQIKLSKEVLYYLAQVSKQSIRELEGHLTRLSYMAQMQETNITLNFAKKIVQEERENTFLTIEEIQNICCESFNVTLAQLKSKTRLKDIVSARHAAMYLCKKYLDKPLQDIGRSFGGKDHSTVINAIRQCENKQNSNPDFANKINDLKERIHILTDC